MTRRRHIKKRNTKMMDLTRKSTIKPVTTTVTKIVRIAMSKHATKKRNMLVVGIEKNINATSKKGDTREAVMGSKQVLRLDH